MSMLDVHREALSKPRTIFHEFLQRYKPNTKSVYAFTEGKDDPSYYINHIENAISRDWSVIMHVAGNRGNVLAIYAMFDWNKYATDRIVFFIDRDLSEFGVSPLPTGQNIYITDHYSIENSACAPDVFTRTVKELLACNPLTHEQEETINRKYISSMDLFQTCLVPIMAQVVHWKRSAGNPCLDDLRMQDLFSFRAADLELIVIIVSEDERLAWAGTRCGIPPVTKIDIEPIICEYLEKDGKNKYIRGKYIAWHFMKMLGAVAQWLHVTSPLDYAQPPSLRLSFGKDNLMTVLGPRTRTPESLLSFVNRTFISFISRTNACLGT